MGIQKIEQAKSWFVLSQLLMILGGFMMASSGIVLTNAQNTMTFGLDKVSDIPKVDCTELQNVTNFQEINVGILDYVQNSVKVGLKTYIGLLWMSVFLISLSLLSYMVGYFKLRKI